MSYVIKYVLIILRVKVDERKKNGSTPVRHRDCFLSSQFKSEWAFRMSNEVKKEYQKGLMKRGKMTSRMTQSFFLFLWGKAWEKRCNKCHEKKMWKCWYLGARASSLETKYWKKERGGDNSSITSEGTCKAGGSHTLPSPLSLSFFIETTFWSVLHPSTSSPLCIYLISPLFSHSQ